ncbi:MULTISPECIES: hypothetical protein [unclassified Nocardioides]|uniref:hypothetical protein n=1 Tax=unclassified Nocardioides TaxID=2615069 RepID=UPI0006FA0FDD|nr:MULTISPECIES: hypothetical protein [unclassified Nocardioides]KRA29529.1 hypothetical protein ASD81_21385 [Nocardioides sp. Root614]KRA88296.1 hypothetical protein ASD84_20230 [Nocardioides sp. Root682]
MRERAREPEPSRQESLRREDDLRSKAHLLPPEQTPVTGPMGPTSMQRLGREVGNTRLSSWMGSKADGREVIQRVPVKYADTGETLYEDPAAPAAAAAAPLTAAAKQFVPTGYANPNPNIEYEIDRKADHALVTVKIQFVQQNRGENKWLKNKAGGFALDKAGNKQPDPTFARDIGTPKEIPAGDKRRTFIATQVKGITAAWDHFDLNSKTVPKAGPPGPDGKAAPAPAPTPINLPLKFLAQPEYSLAAKGVHATIRVFGPNVDADRDGAHPVDSGHWYMNTKKNYGDTSQADLVATSAHEYGHLLGLQDEYFRSDDQTHQMLHKMGGGAATADKELDQHTVRLMVTAALMPVIEGRMSANIGTISETFAKSFPTLRKQLTGAVRNTWADSGLRSGIVSQIEPHLKSKSIKHQLESVVAFQTGQNLSNLTRATDALAATSTKHISSMVLGIFWDWQNAMNGNFKTKGADGSEVTVRTDLSANVTDFGTTGGGKSEASKLADSMIGGPGLPKIAPSTTLLGQLEEIPKRWSEPGKGLDSAYTPAVVTPQITAAVDAAIAAGIFPKINGTGQLYIRLRRLIDSTAKVSANKAAMAFVDGAVQEKVDNQLTELKAQIENEVSSTVGLKAGALAAKGPPDPNVTAIATKLHAMLQAQQNKANYAPGVGEINPGTGSAGTDVRHNSSSVMSSNDVSQAGFRADLIAPVVGQFNSLLKKADEESFTAKVTR